MGYEGKVESGGPFEGSTAKVEGRKTGRMKGPAGEVVTEIIFIKVKKREKA
jgi:hypothetical protein